MPHFVSKINMKIIALAENVGVIFFCIGASQAALLLSTQGFANAQKADATAKNRQTSRMS